MILKISVTMRALSIILSILCCFAFIDVIITQNAKYSIYEIFIIGLGSLILLVGAIFILPTKKIILTPEKFNGYWKIAIGKYILYESKRYQIYWKDFKSVYLFFSIYFPYKVFAITAIKNGHSTFQPLYGYKDLKKGLIYIADHVNPDVLDDDVKKLIEKYRRKLN